MWQQANSAVRHLPERPARNVRALAVRGRVHPIVDEVKRSMPESAQIIVVDLPSHDSPARIGLAVLFDRASSSGTLEKLGFHITGPLVGGNFLGCAVFDQAV